MLYRALRRGTIVKALTGREPFHRCDDRRPLEFHGTGYGGWSILRDSLTAGSRVYSFGIGQDASFDLSLIRKYGCRVQAYDPTPSSVAWVQSTILEPRFCMHPVALADRDQTVRFYLPDRCAADQVSASAVHAPQAADFFEAPGKTLASLWEEQGDTGCDLLKLDIEGMEYAVLPKWLAEGTLAKVSQLCVEFHHFFPGVGANATKTIVRDLRRAGWSVAWISRTNHEYLFVRDVV